MKCSEGIKQDDVKIITITAAAVRRTINNTTVLEKFSIKTETTSRLSRQCNKEQGINFLIANRTQPLLPSLFFLRIVNEGERIS